jgi:hypothetical protein
MIELRRKRRIWGIDNCFPKRDFSSYPVLLGYSGAEVPDSKDGEEA